MGLEIPSWGFVRIYLVIEVVPPKKVWRLKRDPGTTPW
jgi:hypothetical protein